MANELKSHQEKKLGFNRGAKEGVQEHSPKEMGKQIVVALCTNRQVRGTLCSYVLKKFKQVREID